jgi:phage shock protein C
MSRPRYRYSLARQDAKIAGVCSALGNRMGIDPTFVRIGFVAAAFFISWKVALVLYAGLGIWMTLQRKREVDGRSEFERMGDVSTRRPSVHAMRTELDETDRRLMAIDHHLNKPNDELAREIEALREEK